MKFRTLGMLLIMVVMAVFLIINWTTLSQETTVNLVYTEIQAPLGVLVVCGFCAIVVLLGVYTIWQQASMFFEIRTAYKEARRAHQEAEEADKNRVTEASKEIKARIDKLEALVTDRNDEVLQALRENIELLQKTVADAAASQQKDREANRSAITGEIQALARRMTASQAAALPAAASAAEDSADVPAAESAAEAGKLDAEENKKKKKLFGELF